jgi:hypothetical protein
MTILRGDEVLIVTHHDWFEWFPKPDEIMLIKTLTIRPTGVDHLAFYWFLQIDRMISNFQKGR